MKNKLIELIIDAKRTDPETGSFTEYLDDYLIANGVTIEGGSMSNRVQFRRYDTPPTNADRLRAMSDEELARWICKKFSGCYDGTCPGEVLEQHIKSNFTMRKT